MPDTFSSYFYQQLFDEVPDAIVVVDGEGNITLVNRQVEVMFGFTRGELLGQRIEMLVPERFRERHLRHRAAFASAPSVRAMGSGLLLSARHRDGSEFSVFLSVGRIGNTDPPQFVGYLHDTTLRRRALATLEQERQLNRLYLDLAQVMLVATSRAGFVQLVNQRALRVLRIDEAQIISSNWVEACVAPEDRGVARNAFRALLMSGTDEPQSAIVAVIMPDLERGAAMWEALLREGLYVNLARPPATPAGMTLLRCSLCAEHTSEEVETILGMFERAGKAVGII